jgi:hypothetical protein
LKVVATYPCCRQAYLDMMKERHPLRCGSTSRVGEEDGLPSPKAQKPQSEMVVPRDGTIGATQIVRVFDGTILGFTSAELESRASGPRSKSFQRVRTTALARRC